MFSASIADFGNDTINTLLDFTILSVKQGDNTTVKLAPYVPITLGRSQPNFANNRDAGTATGLGSGSATSSNNFATRKITISNPTNDEKTALYALKAGDAIYNENGVFIGRSLYGVNVNGSNFAIEVEKPILGSKVSAKELFVYDINNINDKKQHDLLLTNGEHLHGGKIISLLGPNNRHLNYSNFNNANEFTYQATFGSSIFRVISLEKGEIGPTFISHEENQVTGSTTVGQSETTRPFYIRELEFNYYATAYKGLDVTSVNKTGTSTNNGWPHEQCGIIPITGSNYYDRKRYPNAASETIGINFVFPYHSRSGTSLINHLPYSKSTFYHIDPTASRLFLFVNSDRHIYSSTRKDSLMNTVTRNITDYNLLTMGEPKTDTTGEEKESIVGNTLRRTLIDKSYKSNAIIESSKTLSDLTRFGLMRLTECVWDFMWNPINPEKEPDTEKTVYSNEDNYSYNLEGKKSGGNLIINSWSGDVATFADADLDVGDYLVDATAGGQLSRIFGEVSSINGNDVTIDSSTAVKTKLVSNVAEYPTGTVFRIPNGESGLTANLTGFQKGGYLWIERLMGNKINLSRYLVFNSVLGGFSAESSTDWYKQYSGNNLAGTVDSILITNATGITGYGNGKKNIILPVAFESGGNNYATHNPIITHITQTCTSNGTTTLTVADSSVFKYGDLVQPNASLGLSGTDSAYHFITATPTSNTVTLNVAAGGSGGTGSVVFTVKRSPKTYHNNAIFKWWDKFNLARENSSIPETSLMKLKITFLQGYTVSGSSGFLTAGTSARLHHLVWGSVVGDNNFTYTYPIFSIDSKDYANHAGSIKSTTNTNSNPLDGAVIGITAGLYSGDFNTPTDRKANNNKTYKEYSIQLDSEYKFLEMVDLTGCYLVPCDGNYESGTAFNPVASTLSHFSTHNLTANDIIYVVSHEYDTKTSMSNINTDACILTLDKAFDTNTHYKIMQPNPVAFWPKSPKNITLNELSAKYTKQSDSDKMYSNFNDYDISKGNAFQENDSSLSLEGIQSMYVVVDVDNLGGSDNTVLKTYTELNNAIGNINKEVCISDGNTNVVTSLATDNTNTFSIQCEFGKISKKMKGVLSVSETFDLTVAGDVTIDDKRAMIGSTLNIVKESEDLIEEFLEENGVDYSLTKESYPLYASPDFQGGSTFAVINYLLSLKDKKIVDNAGILDVVNTSNKVVKFTFTDENILEFKQVNSQFDFYNEVTVYGSGKKSTRKDIKSIKEKGRKTLEVFLEELTTQADVDKKAYQLLRLHSNPKSNLEINLPIDAVKNIHVGDVVNCEIKAGNIEMNQYIVLETIHQTTGIIKLKLGKYYIGLDDTFAELLLQNQKIKSYNRKKTFAENENAFDFFSNLKIKEMQLTLRKRTTTGTTIGFENVLNTNATVLGFGGQINHTVLLEEDL